MSRQFLRSVAVATLVVAFVGATGAFAADVTEDEIDELLDRQAAEQASNTGTKSGNSRIVIFDEDSPSDSEGFGVYSSGASGVDAGTSVVSETPANPAVAAASPEKATAIKDTRRPVKAALRPPVVEVPVLPEGARLDLKILFDYDSAFVRPESRSQLRTLCNVIERRSPSEAYIIIGHTDSAGSSVYNMNLSMARAEEVRRHLVSECEISGDRLKAVGMGEERLDPNHKPRSGEQRRVEIQLSS